MDVKTVCVVGGGTMGWGIASVAAVGGYDVRLVDVSQAVLDGATINIEKSLDAGRARGKVSDDEAVSARARISTHTDLESGAAPADCVIEAIPENLLLKLEIFKTLERVCRDAALLATNTSALSITEIASVVSAPGRVIGMHFFNPVPRMKLIEIVRGLETTDAATETARSIGIRMGKQPVVINESPGFITTRMNASIGNEAFFMLQEGVAGAEEIDRAIKLGLNHPMGPFEMVDLVGLDTRLSIMKYLHAVLGEKYRPCPLLEQYVKAGRLGRKVGRGVFEYPEHS